MRRERPCCLSASIVKAASRSAYVIGLGQLTAQAYQTVTLVLHQNVAKEGTQLGLLAVALL